MTYKFDGSVSILLPNEIEIDAESKEKAVEELLKGLLKETCIEDIDMDDLEIKVVKKVFKVEIRETFVNTVEISQEEYPNVLDEDDAWRYVEDHYDQFSDDFCYDFGTCYDTETEITCDDYCTEEIECDPDD